MAEVTAIVAHIAELLLERRYDGSVGVSSTFPPQVLALEEAIASRNPEIAEKLPTCGSVRSMVAGAGRDLILFSPVVHTRAAQRTVALRAEGLASSERRDQPCAGRDEIAGRRLDFALFSARGAKLDVEVDGRRWHQDIDGNRKLDDHWRDYQLRSLGWTVRRFWVDELDRDMEGCADLIERDLA